MKTDLVNPDDFNVSNPKGTLSGEVAFKLYATYGFPLDMTADICRERGFNVDFAGFYAVMQRHKDQSRTARRTKR